MARADEPAHDVGDQGDAALARGRLCGDTETAPGERRVALVPDVVRKLVGADHEVVVEPGAGAAAGFPDGATRRRRDARRAPWDAEVVVKVAPPSPEGAAPGRDRS